MQMPSKGKQNRIAGSACASLSLKRDLALYLGEKEVHSRVVLMEWGDEKGYIVFIIVGAEGDGVLFLCTPPFFFSDIVLMSGW